MGLGEGQGSYTPKNQQFVARPVPFGGWGGGRGGVADTPNTSQNLEWKQASAANVLARHTAAIPNEAEPRNKNNKKRQSTLTPDPGRG